MHHTGTNPSDALSSFSLQQQQQKNSYYGPYSTTASELDQIHK